MLDALLVTIALARPIDAPSPPRVPVVAAAAADGDSSRSWHVSRPDRGAYRSLVRAAATPAPAITSWAVCVLDRESGGTFDRRQSGAGALNTAGSGAAGRWQFMPAWRHGLPYMIRDRLVQFGMPPKQARQVRLFLSELYYINRYPGLYQDIGMLEVVERGGWFHWNGHTCGRP